jgi:hypothetical protein
MNQNFYEMRGNCYGHNLDDLWEKIRMVDLFQKKARDYVEAFLNEPEKYERDILFRRSISLKIKFFENALKEYQEIFLEKYFKGFLFFEVNRTNKNFEEKKESESDLIVKCKTCEIIVPRLKYVGWGK